MQGLNEQAAPAHRGPGGLTASGGTARVSVAQRSLRRPVRRQPVVDDAVAQPQECIEGQVFDVMRVQASDRQASWKTQMASTNQRPRTATLAAYVPTSGSIRMPGVNPLPHGSSDSPQ